MTSLKFSKFNFSAAISDNNAHFAPVNRLNWAYFMFNNRFRKYFRFAQMTSFIFETIIEFSAAIKNVYAQLVLMNRGLTSTYANLNATVGPADLFVPLRNKSSS